VTEFENGDRVWWLHTGSCRRAGTVADIDGGTVGVMPDDDPRSLLYLNPNQLRKVVALHGV
jgi:hypothetical protein